MSLSRRRTHTALTVLAYVALVSLACETPGTDSGVATPAALTRAVEVGPLTIDGIADSTVAGYQRAELDTEGVGWITGLRTEVLEAASGLPLGDELYFHGRIQMDTGSPLMVAATGIQRVQLPAGFGIPLHQILGDLEPEWRGVSLMGTVLAGPGATLRADVNLRFNVDYVAADDAETAATIRPLYRASATIVPGKPSVKFYAGNPPVEVTSPPAVNLRPGHWVVPPGQQIVRQRYRGLIGAETQVHFGVAQLNEHGRLLSLTDVTTGDVLWQVEARYAADRDRIVEIPVYSSQEGFTLYPDHAYELAAVYDNTTDEPVDARATMYLYHEPAGGRTLTYPPPPGAVPPGAEGAAPVEQG